MEDRTWSFSLTSSSKYDQSYSDDYVDYEEIDGDTDIEPEYPCPFCSEDFDIVGLCCHIEEEHYDEAIRGVCPICGIGIGADLVEHIAFQHENLYKSGNSTRHSHGDSQSTLALLRKEMLERSLNSLLGSSSSVVSSSDAAVDQLLTSFVCSYSTPSEAENKLLHSSTDASLKEKVMGEDMLESTQRRTVFSFNDRLSVKCRVGRASRSTREHARQSRVSEFENPRKLKFSGTSSGRTRTTRRKLYVWGADFYRNRWSLTYGNCQPASSCCNNYSGMGMKSCVISEEKQEEHAQRCKFMQSIVFSTMLDNDDGL